MSQQSHSAPAPTGTTGATQTSPIRDIQVGGTLTSPPPQPRKHTESGGTQTTPTQQPHHHGDTQGQPDHNHAKDDDQQDQGKGKTSNKGKKGKKKPSEDTSPCPGITQGTDTVPRTNFSSRNLGTGRPSIQCTACGEYSHWRKDCPYDNFCTTCNNHDHATHMCRATQQSPTICIHCGSTDHRPGNCPSNPWDNREQPCETPDTLRQQN